MHSCCGLQHWTTINGVPIERRIQVCCSKSIVCAVDFRQARLSLLRTQKHDKEVGCSCLPSAYKSPLSVCLPSVDCGDLLVRGSTAFHGLLLCQHCLHAVETALCSCYRLLPPVHDFFRPGALRACKRMLHARETHGVHNPIWTHCHCV